MRFYLPGPDFDVSTECVAELGEEVSLQRLNGRLQKHNIKESL